VASHKVDFISLVGGVVFVGFGVVGLLRGAGWIEGGSLFWAAVVVVAGLGALGVAASLLALTSGGAGGDEEAVAAEPTSEVLS
jgi:hypothetical protein